MRGSVSSHNPLEVRVDEFAEAQQSLSKPGVAGWWDRAPFSDEQWARLNAAADDPSISRRAIAIVLASWGMDVSVTQVGYWRQTRVG